MLARAPTARRHRFDVWRTPPPSPWEICRIVGTAERRNSAAVAAKRTVRPCRSGRAVATNSANPGSARRADPASAIQGAGTLAKAHVAFMIDEGVAGQRCRQPLARRPHTEIILLAVAPAERLGVEQSDVAERVAADVHAEADGGGHLHSAAAIRFTARRIHRRRASAPAASGRLARWGSCRSSRCSRRATTEAMRGSAWAWRRQSAAASLAGPPCRCSAARRRALSGRLHPAIDRDDEAEISPVADQPDAPVAFTRSSQRGQLGVGRAVVQHDDACRADAPGRRGPIRGSAGSAPVPR